MAGYVPTPKKTLISCGGYNLKNSTYVGFCQKFLEDGKPWKAGPDLQTARAWGSAFSIGGGLATQGLYVAGGYSATEGFIDSGINQTESIRLGVTLSVEGVILVLKEKQMKALLNLSLQLRNTIRTQAGAGLKTRTLSCQQKSRTSAPSSTM